ncbi:MAG: hypothetical protein ACHRHE_06055 [Tepidisphaerales bacterium]
MSGVQTMLPATLITSVLVLMAVTVTPMASSGADKAGDGTTTLFRKPLAEGREIVCLRRPDMDMDAAVFKDLWGAEIEDRTAVVYEFNVELRTGKSSPVNLWSTLFRLPRKNAQGADAKGGPRPATPAPGGVQVLDLAFVPGHMSGNRVVPGELVLAVRGAGGFALCRLVLLHHTGNEVSWSSPPPGEWSLFDTPVPADPAKVVLSTSPDGRWLADVTSRTAHSELHTSFEQVPGQWTFKASQQKKTTTEGQ